MSEATAPQPPPAAPVDERKTLADSLREIAKLIEAGQVSMLGIGYAFVCSDCTETHTRTYCYVEKDEALAALTLAGICGTLTGNAQGVATMLSHKKRFERALAHQESQQATKQ